MKKVGIILIAIAVFGILNLVSGPEKVVAEQGSWPALSVSISAPVDGSTFDVGEEIEFKALVPSENPGVPPYAFVWDFGDGKSAFGQSYKKTYTEAGSYTVGLIATDFESQTAEVEIVVHIAEVVTPELDISIDVDQTNIKVGESLTFEAIVNSKKPGDNPVSFVWKVDAVSEGFGETFTKTFDTEGSFEVQLDATDFFGETDTDTVTIVVSDDNNGGGGDDLVISNVQVTNVTQTSATITWTTNLSADSRVIYDTQSHSDISGESAPNFGYQFSTDTSNSGGVTSHEVTLTGLSSNTQYYFRVLSREVE